APLTQAVNQDATTTTLSTSLSPLPRKQSVTFTATVASNAPGSGTPTGTITFYDGTSTLGPAVLVNGQASICTSALSVGDHSITAVYSGDANFTTSTSAALTQTILSIAPTITASGNSTVYAGSIYTLNLLAQYPATNPNGQI